MPSPGRLRGLVGQRMAGRAVRSQVVGLYSKLAGSGVLAAPSFPTAAEVWLVGAGGGGHTGGGFGGDGGGAAYKRFRCAPGVLLPYSTGVGGVGGGSPTFGGATSITLPNGLSVIATGGGPGNGSHVGGSGQNGDVNRTGGAGSLTNGAAGEFGGAGGIAGGGGGGAGFGDIGYPLGGAGGNGGLSGNAPGGGGGNASANGADGQLMIAFTRLQ